MSGAIRIGALLLISSSLLGCSHSRLCHDPCDPCSSYGYGYSHGGSCGKSHHGLCGWFKRHHHDYSNCCDPCGSYGSCSDPILTGCGPACGGAFYPGAEFGDPGCASPTAVPANGWMGGSVMPGPMNYHGGGPVMPQPYSSGCASCGIPHSSGQPTYEGPTPVPAPAPGEDESLIPDPSSAMMAPMMAPGSNWMPTQHQQFVSPVPVQDARHQPVFNAPVYR